jgi:hypothetical protein
VLDIENLCLRIPGLSAEESRRLGEEIAQRLAGRLPARRTPLCLDALNLHLTVPVGTERGRLAELITAAILEKLA